MNNVEELKATMPDSDYDSHAEERAGLALNESGVQVYLAHEDYFPLVTVVL